MFIGIILNPQTIRKRTETLTTVTLWINDQVISVYFSLFYFQQHFQVLNIFWQIYPKYFVLSLC